MFRIIHPLTSPTPLHLHHRKLDVTIGVSIHDMWCNTSQCIQYQSSFGGDPPKKDEDSLFMWIPKAVEGDDLPTILGLGRVLIDGQEQGKHRPSQSAEVLNQGYWMKFRQDSNCQ